MPTTISRPRRALGALVAVPLLATTAAVSTAGPAAAARCEESTYRTYSVSSQGWATINEQVDFAPYTSGNQTVRAEVASSRSVSVSGSVGASLNLQLAEINNQVAVDYARSVTITTSTSTTINVPSRAYVQTATFGIWRVHYYVTATRITPSCARTPAGSGYIDVYRKRAALTRG